jgi:TM2 domain-containing membrane protein YozV
MENFDTKQCPMCGELIKAVAIRCKHCQADLTKIEPAAPEFDRGVNRGAGTKLSQADFEMRFLDFAYKTSEPINALTVAYALKIPITDAEERLEDLAARDILEREVDDEARVFFKLPGRPPVPAAPVPSTAMQRYTPPSPPAPRKPDEGTALGGLLVNALVLPGLGSLIAGKTTEGVIQLVLFVIGVPLCLVLIGVPMILTAWAWGLATGIRVMNEVKQQQSAPPPPAP